MNRKHVSSFMMCNSCAYTCTDCIPKHPHTCARLPPIAACHPWSGRDGARARRGGGGSGSHSVGTFFSRRPSRPRGHAHRPRSLKFPRPLRLAPGFEACFIRSTARSKELPCAGSSSSSASTRAFLPRWSTSTSCYCTRVLPECTQTRARWLARLCALCPSSKRPKLPQITASVTAHAASHRRLLNNHSTPTGTLARPRLRDDAPRDEHLMSIFIPCVSRVRARLSREPLLGLDVFVIWPCGAS
jgi:hypothetical protein